MNLMEDQRAPQSAEGEAKVITLCGSTKFEADFAEVNQRLTMEGCVVISLGMFRLPDLPDYDWTADSSDLRGRLGGLHFQKIRMADEVYIVDPGGYVDEPTRREIAYAESLGKAGSVSESRALDSNGRRAPRVSPPRRSAHRQLRTSVHRPTPERTVGLRGLRSASVRAASKSGAEETRTPDPFDANCTDASR
jgi:hypothetical protein